MTEKIVYTQKELDTLLASGYSGAVLLCSGIFKIPKVQNVTFKRIGPIAAEVMCDAFSADKAGMRFIDIYPVYKSAYAIDTPAGQNPVAVTFGGSYGSYGSYGSGSYGSYLGSFRTSGGSYGSHTYSYEYEYEYERGSFRTSYGSAAGGSFSYRYMLSSSFSGSFSGSLGGSFRKGGSFSGNPSLSGEMVETKNIKVYGYGINLI